MDIEHSILHSKVEYPFKVKIMPVVGDNSQWTWCCDNVPDGKWKVLLHDCLDWCIDNAPGTYTFGWAKDCWVFEFSDGEDATAFKLKFGL